MTILRNIHRKVTVTALLTLLLLASCSKVRFAGEINSVDGNMTTESMIRFAVDWSSVGSEMPVEMTVLMNRIQNVTLHYAWHVDGSGNIIAPIAPATPLLIAEDELPSEDTPSEDTPSDDTPSDDTPSEDTPSDDTPSDDTPSDDTPSVTPSSYSVINGLYTIMAVAACDKQDYIIPDIERYRDSLAYSTKELYVNIPGVPDSVRFKQNLIDLNPMCPFIRTVKPLYYVRSDNNALVSAVNESEADGHVTIPIAPEKLTHNISFKVFLRTEDPSRADETTTEVRDSVIGVVYLDTLKAAISGIPTSAQLMSGYVSDMMTGKMGFNMKKKEESRVTDGASELNLYEGNYTGSVNAFGLFPSLDKEILAGPGILNIFLYPKVYYENAFGKKVALTRVFHASINIKDEIEDARIMLRASNRDFYVYGRPDDVELEVRTNIELSYQDVLSGTSQGLKEWENNELGPDDNFNPGLEM